MRFAVRGRQWGIIFSRSPRIGFVIVFSLTILLLASVAAAYTLINHYIATTELSNANAAFSAGNIDAADKAARKTEVVDLGKINNHYFLTSARLQASDSLALRCEDSYTLRPLDPRSALIIANLGIGTNCQDGYLEATIESGGRGWWGRKKRSVVPLRHGTILAANASTGTAVAENAYTIKLPATIEVIPKMLKMIVGRERAF
ncbi:MAG: hypothetical protein UX68_C0010G0063 [Parcubacteria group bacterium GW2011_GWA2_46_9]|nr:MAG: hypothetical protein UX68_C0010G0063 [Parcubacteria group bacterium GW2011_GWA2_46_9]